MWALPPASKWVNWSDVVVGEVVFGMVLSAGGIKAAAMSTAGVVRGSGASGYHSIVKSNSSRHSHAGRASAARRRVALTVTLALPLALLPALPGHAQFKTLPAPRPEVNLPTLGDTERETLSLGMERKLGEEIMRDIRRDHDYLDDDPILEYLNDFGNALVEARPGARGETSFDYGFFAVRDTQLNAFALPGGFIAVHSALLLAAQTESELASVMSHEIGHVAQRHIARMLGQQRQDALIPLAGLVLAALASQVGSGGGNAALGVFAAGQGLAMQRQLNFSRDAEREADRIGFQIMDDAGFDTSGMVAFFGRMQTASRSYSDLTPAYLLSHPLTTERIADIQARIREMPYRQRADSLDFHLVRARARVLQDESSQGLVDAGAMFETQLAQPNRREIAAAQYGLAFIALKKNDPLKAQTWLAAARATVYPAPNAGVFGMAGAQAPNAILSSMALDIMLAPGAAQTPKEALKQAQAAHGQFPRSRGIARQVAEAMIAAGQLDDAARYLRDQIQLYRQEHKLHDVLARTYAAQGKIALQHMELAESYALRGAMLAALDQLTLARKAGDASFYDMSVIDAREREWQARRLEEIKESKK
jgi:predicted Zn-dependent protease